MLSMQSIREERNKGVLMFISFYLDSGPMQSWGYGSNLKERFTRTAPTQSAMSGIICKKMGLFESRVGRKKFLEFLSKINEGTFYSLLFSEPNILTDFQTIGTNYKHDQIYRAGYYEKSLCDKSSSGVIVKKYYLEDVVTGCIIEHQDNDFLEEIKYYCRHPQSFVGLGRSTCIPTSPIFNSIDETMKESFISLVNRVNNTRKTMKIKDNSFIKMFIPSIDGQPVNDIMIDKDKYASRLIIEEDKSLVDWLKWTETQ